MTLRSLALIVGISACGSPEAQTPDLRGRDYYGVYCIACHNPNPALAGPLGPPVTGASRELLEARILRAQYPPGYKPKRETKQMVPMPHLEPYIDDLAAFLKEP